jgi:hypothetical protein
MGQEVRQQTPKVNLAQLRPARQHIFKNIEHPFLNRIACQFVTKRTNRKKIDLKK